MRKIQTLDATVFQLPHGRYPLVLHYRARLWTRDPLFDERQSPLSHTYSLHPDGHERLILTHRIPHTH